MTLLSIKNLSIEFPGRYETDFAVEGVSFDLEPGEVLGLVGESGAGKSTIGNGIVQLLSPPGRVSKGEIYLNDSKISDFSEQQILKVRGSRVGFIFKDPMTSLKPLFTV
jgi:peptide/nickel transport system ATP-binding protein